MAAAPIADIGEASKRRRPRIVDRPGKPTPDGGVTLGFRGTERDDELIRKAVSLGGFYSKADLIRSASLELATKLAGADAARERQIAEAAKELGVDPDELIKSTLDELLRRAKKHK